MAALWHMEFLGRGTDRIHSCRLSCHCSNAGSLTHCAGPGIEPVSQHSQDNADPIVPQQECLKVFIINVFWILSDTFSVFWDDHMCVYIYIYIFFFALILLKCVALFHLWMLNHHRISGKIPPDYDVWLFHLVVEFSFWIFCWFYVFQECWPVIFFSCGIFV